MNKKYHYADSGLDNIWLLSGFTRHQIDGEEATSIDDIDNLHKIIGKSIVDSQSNISPAEFRFLRVELGLSQKNLAHILRVDSQTIARWEKSESSINGSSELVLRAYYTDFIGGKSDIVALCKRMAELDEMEAAVKREYSKDDDGWKVCA